MPLQPSEFGSTGTTGATGCCGRSGGGAGGATNNAFGTAESDAAGAAFGGAQTTRASFSTGARDAVIRGSGAGLGGSSPSNVIKTEVGHRHTITQSAITA